MCLDLSIVVLTFCIFVIQWVVFKQRLQETRDLQREELEKALAEVRRSRASTKGLHNQREELMDYIDVYDEVANNQRDEMALAIKNQRKELMNTIDALYNRVARLDAIIQTHVNDSDRRHKSLTKLVCKQREELMDYIEVYDEVTNNRLNDSDRRHQFLNKRVCKQREELIDHIEVYDEVTNNRINDLKMA